jgi:hypothetical protein
VHPPPVPPLLRRGSSLSPSSSSLSSSSSLKSLFFLVDERSSEKSPTPGVVFCGFFFLAQFWSFFSLSSVCLVFLLFQSRSHLREERIRKTKMCVQLNTSCHFSNTHMVILHRRRRREQKQTNKETKRDLKGIDEWHLLID